MNTNMIWAALLCAGLVVATWTHTPNAEAQSGGCCVAVVDVEQAIQQLDERTDLNADLKRKLEGLQQDTEQKRKEIEDLRADLELLLPGSDAFLTKEGLIEEKTIGLKAWQDFQMLKIQRENAILYESLYKKLVEAAGSVARANGYKVVLFKERLNFNARKPDEVAKRVAQRKIIWAADDLDLTDELVQKMNNDFKNPS